MAATTEENVLALQNPGSPMKSIAGPDVASAAGAMVVNTPLRSIQRVTGALALTLIPLPYPEFEGTLYFIPTGAFTGATGGTATAVNKPIAVAFTAVVSRVLGMTYLAQTGLWYPHYV